MLVLTVLDFVRCGAARTPLGRTSSLSKYAIESGFDEWIRFLMNSPA